MDAEIIGLLEEQWAKDNLPCSACGGDRLQGVFGRKPGDPCHAPRK